MGTWRGLLMGAKQDRRVQ